MPIQRMLLLVQHTETKKRTRTEKILLFGTETTTKLQSIKVYNQ